jgi:hypothetical protein
VFYGSASLPARRIVNGAQTRFSCAAHLFANRLEPLLGRVRRTLHLAGHARASMKDTKPAECTRKKKCAMPKCLPVFKSWLTMVLTMNMTLVRSISFFFHPNTVHIPIELL